MKSREDETFENLTNNHTGYGTNSILFEIAMSLGRIADMLAEHNGYVVDYEEEKRKKK